MSQLKEIRTSLEVGFAAGGLPVEFERFRGKETRAIGNVPEFPYEDSQFDAVLMDGAAVSRKSVKEAHRVLRRDGCLHFMVLERTKSQDGVTLPEIYSVVREGFNIIGVARPPWWWFGRHGRTITVCAQKKNWKSLTNTYRPYV